MDFSNLQEILKRVVNKQDEQEGLPTIPKDNSLDLYKQEEPSVPEYEIPADLPEDIQYALNKNSSSIYDEPEASPSREPASEKKKMGVSQFLQAISGIESNFGKNIKHKTLESGMHKGQRAIGKYGLMPNTVNDIIDRMPEKSDQTLLALRNASPEQKIQLLEQNEALQDRLATSLANRLVDRYGSPSKAALAWNSGHYRDPNKMTPEVLASNPYVNKFKQVRKKLGY